jgi:hypothetical protein
MFLSSANHKRMNYIGIRGPPVVREEDLGITGLTKPS